MIDILKNRKAPWQTFAVTKLPGYDLIYHQTKYKPYLYFTMIKRKITSKK